MNVYNFDGTVNSESISLLVKGLNENDILSINSPGGDIFAGYAAYEKIAPLNITTLGVGIVASAAAILFIGGKKRIATPTSRYLLHFPYGYRLGNADELRTEAELMQIEQNKVVDFFADRLTISKEELIELMRKDELIDAEEALRIGLATDIKTDVKFELSEISQNNFSSLMSLKTILNKLKTTPDVKNQVVIKDVNGTPYTFEGIVTAEEIAVGAKVNTETGEAYTGEIVLLDGITIVCAAGVVTEIKPKQTTPGTSEVEDAAAVAEVFNLIIARLEKNEKSMAMVLNQIKTISMDNDKIKGFFKPDEDKKSFNNKTEKFTTSADGAKIIGDVTLLQKLKK